MSVGLSFTEFIEYTDWERDNWREWFQSRGDEILATSAGPHGDGRFQSVGDVVRHIFSAEKRYIDRLANRPLTDTAAVPSNSIATVFEFGKQRRAEFKEFLRAFPREDWDVMREFDFLNGVLRATPRKFVVQALMHEIRHWAQLGTLFRLNGEQIAFEDFVLSPVLGGDLRRPAS
ncbi:MAG: DinB family protein [Candidatus Acidiferrales bacterium]